MPTAEGAGWNHLEGWIDVNNHGSRRVLEKCGFVLCEEMSAPGDAPGHVERVAVLRPREGMDLGEMGLMIMSVDRRHEGRVVPPVE